jgi:hypothetical protein
MTLRITATDVPETVTTEACEDSDTYLKGVHRNVGTTRIAPDQGASHCPIRTGLVHAGSRTPALASAMVAFYLTL